MNSNSAESLTSAQSPSSNTSSPTADSSQMKSLPVDDFLTQPLTGLLPPQFKATMTEQELRDYAQNVRNLRQSYQTFRAEMEKGAQVEPKEPPKVAMKAFDELFE